MKKIILLLFPILLKAQMLTLFSDDVALTYADTAQTYYVDATSGNDANTGLSPDQAWQTIDKVNSSTFHPADSILFKRGEEWRDTTLYIQWSGAENYPIVFGAYGSGDKPIFNGADTVISWVATGDTSNQVADGDFSGSSWLTQAGWTETGGVGVASSVPNTNLIYQNSIAHINIVYEISFNVVTITEGGFKAKIGAAVSGYTKSDVGVYKDTLTALGNEWVGVAAAGITSGTIDNFSIKIIQTIWKAPSQNRYQDAKLVTVLKGDVLYTPVDSLINLDSELEYWVLDTSATSIEGDSIFLYSGVDPNLLNIESSISIYGILDNTPCQYITIQNLDIRNYGYGGIDVRNGSPTNTYYVIDSVELTFNRIMGVHFYNDAHQAIIRNSRASYSGNGFYANNADNISFINDSSYNIISYVQDGAVSGTDGHGFGCYKADNTLIEYCYGADNDGGNIGIDSPSDPNSMIIRYNEFHSPDNYAGSVLGGNLLSAGSTINIYNNIIVVDDSNNYAFAWNTANGDLNLYNNTIIIQDEINYAIRVENADNITFKNNIVFNALGGATDGFLWIYTGNGTPISDNNIWYDENSITRWGQRQGVVNYATLTEWTDSTSQDVNSFTTDPLFTTEFTDLSLQAGSNAINNGTDVGLTTDILGNPIVGNPDIGAYEKQD